MRPGVSVSKLGDPKKWLVCCGFSVKPAKIGLPRKRHIRGYPFLDGWTDDVSDDVSQVFVVIFELSDLSGRGGTRPGVNAAPLFEALLTDTVPYENVSQFCQSHVRCVESMLKDMKMGVLMSPKHLFEMHPFSHAPMNRRRSNPSCTSRPGVD